MQNQECPIHKEPLEELWKGQLDCQKCFEEYHEHMIEAMAHKMVEQFQIEEGRVD